LPERSDFLEGDEPAADKVEAFLAKALDTIAANPEGTAHALVPWISDVLLSNHSIKAYGRDFLDFVLNSTDAMPAPTRLAAVSCLSRSDLRPRSAMATTKRYGQSLARFPCRRSFRTRAPWMKPLPPTKAASWTHRVSLWLSTDCLQTWSDK
jgi:hypothetical protein